MMKPLLTLVLLVACAAGAAAQAAKAPAAKAQKQRTKLLAATRQPDRIVTYKKVGERELHLHIYDPKGVMPGDKRPCFFTIHGGGWTGGNPEIMHGYAQRFADRGWVGISLEYRLHNAGKGVSVEDCVKDARSAMRFIRAHAAEWGIDESRIVVNGASAGGHLAASLALFQDVNEPGDDQKISTMPAAMVLFYPVIDTGPGGYGNAKAGPEWKRISPVDRVTPNLPPTLILHGTGDTTTPYAGAKLFQERMTAAGNRCDLITHEGGGHGYFVFDDQLFVEAVAAMDRWLGALGYPVD